MEGKGGLYKVRDTSSPATSPSILYPPQTDLILLIPPLYPLSSFLSSSQPSLFREDPFWPFPRVSFASPLFPNFHHFIFILVEILLMQSMLVSVIRDVPIFNPPLCVELCCFPLSNVILFLLQETEKKEKEVEEQQRQQDPPPQPYAMAIEISRRGRGRGRGPGRGRGGDGGSGGRGGLKRPPEQAPPLTQTPKKASTVPFFAFPIVETSSSPGVMGTHTYPCL